MEHQTALYLIVNLLVFARHVQSQYCYFPAINRNVAAIAKNQKPCNPYGSVSSCCPIGWSCSSNLLCVMTDDQLASSSGFPVGSLMRGTCTNPGWDDSVCGTFCRDLKYSKNGGVEDCGSQRYCCSYDIQNGLCDCASGQGTFHLPNGYIENIVVNKHNGHAVTKTGLPISAYVSSTSANVGPTGGPGPSHTGGSPGTSSSQTTHTGAPGNGPGSGSNSPNEPQGSKGSDGSSGLSTGAIVGIVVGAVALVAIVILGIFLCRIRRRRKKNAASGPPEVGGISAPHVAEGDRPPLPDPYTPEGRATGGGVPLSTTPNGALPRSNTSGGRSASTAVAETSQPDTSQRLFPLSSWSRKRQQREQQDSQTVWSGTPTASSYYAPSESTGIYSERPFVPQFNTAGTQDDSEVESEAGRETEPSQATRQYLGLDPDPYEPPGAERQPTPGPFR